MKTAAFMGTMLLGAATMAADADVSQPFDQANRAFAEQHFAEAARGYQAILDARGFSAPVLFNLGNAYELVGQPGRAILNYERAQLLVPRDADIAANLSLARRKAGLAESPMEWFEKAARGLSFNTLAWLGAAAWLFLAAGGLAVRHAIWNGFHAGGWITVNALVLMAVGVAVGLRWSDLSRGIVIVRDLPVYISPVATAQPLFKLSEGQDVKLRKTHGDFVFIRTPEGRCGWTRRADVPPIIPASDRRN